jgi:hypothetical protein
MWKEQEGREGEPEAFLPCKLVCLHLLVSLRESFVFPFFSSNSWYIKYGSEYQNYQGEPQQQNDWDNWEQQYQNGNYEQQQQQQAQQQYQDGNWYQQANQYQQAQQYQQANGYQQANNEQQQGGRRGRRQLQEDGSIEVIDCQECMAMGCYDGQFQQQGNYNKNQQEEEVDVQEIAEWVATIAGCSQTESSLNDYSLYAGFMCNEDGTGVEVALFLDEYCSVYTSKYSYQSTIDEEDQAAVYHSQSLVTYGFLNDISCANVEYVSPEEYQEQEQERNQNYYYYNQDYDYAYEQQEQPEANEFCQNLFEGGDDGAPLSLDDCNDDGYYDDVENVVYEYYNYDWYTYVLPYAESEDPQAVCKIIQAFQGEFQTVYKYNGSGQLYNYGGSGRGKRTADADDIRSFFKNVDRLEAGMIAAIVLASVATLCAFCCILYSCCCASSVPNRYAAYERGYGRRERLVDERTGELL